MKKYVGALIIVLVCGLLVLPFLLPKLYWKLTGWQQGMAFYRGMPTRWWELEIENTYFPAFVAPMSVTRESRLPSFDSNQTTIWREVHSQHSIWDYCTANWSKNAPTATGSNNVGTSLTAGDRDSLPVLLELVNSKVPKVRQVAVNGLGVLYEFSPEVRSTVLRMTGDEDPNVRKEAIAVLKEMEDKDEKEKRNEESAVPQ